MSDLTMNLLELINQELTINEISQKLNLTNQQIYNIITQLENKGFVFNREYYSTGDIIYVLRKKLFESENINIYTEEDEQVITILDISDLHYGNIHENPHIIDLLFNYCIIKGIHIIFCGGDFIDGILRGSGRKKHKNIIDQVEYAIKKYPFDKNILTFTVLGNHDISTLNKIGLDFARLLHSYRHDIISVGYGKGEINIKNDKIILRHPLLRTSIPHTELLEPLLVIDGHSHQMKIKTTPNDLCILTVPSLCDSKFDFAYPGAVEMTLEFKNGLINTATFEQLAIMDNKIHKVNKSTHYLARNKEIKEEISLEKSKTKKRILKPTKFIDECKL